MSEVIWKPIPRLPGFEASSLGEIKGPDGKIRKVNYSHSSGYPFFIISFPVHRLICEAFHGLPPFQGAQVLHGPDHSKKNFKPDNLRWGTSQENSDDCITAGRANPPKGESHGRAVLNLEHVKEARRRYDQGESAKVIWRELAQAFDITYQAYYKMLTRKTWKEV